MRVLKKNMRYIDFSCFYKIIRYFGNKIAISMIPKIKFLATVKLIEKERE